MQRISDLSKDELRRFVRVVQDHMYVVYSDGMGNEDEETAEEMGYHFDPDKEISGGDFVESMGDLLNTYGLVPKKWSRTPDEDFG